MRKNYPGYPEWDERKMYPMFGWAENLAMMAIARDDGEAMKQFVADGLVSGDCEVLGFDGKFRDYAKARGAHKCAAALP